MFKVNDKNNDVNDVVLVFLLLTLNIFLYISFCNVCIVDFEQVNVSWAIDKIICNQTGFGAGNTNESKQDRKKNLKYL